MIELAGFLELLEVHIVGIFHGLPFRAAELSVASWTVGSLFGLTSKHNELQLRDASRPIY